jgi:glutaredoxin
MAKDVTIYTSNTCAYCHAVKEFFDKKEVSYQEINLDEQPDRRQEMVDLSGQMAVPVTIISGDDGSQSMTIGCDTSKLASELGV